ncbi:MAG: pyridoxamine 5'-phosphate oxidase family protein, partial [Actinobacteria bacterium]|nr:pyridoxamine 5'-phosphate oxidase family protein [Actinomycetota bacterium]
MTDYRKLRVEYTNQTLNESDLAKNPLEQFRKWMADASELPEPNAMVLATADESGQPSSRLV